MTSDPEMAAAFAEVWSRLDREDRDELWGLVSQPGEMSQRLWLDLGERRAGIAYGLEAWWSDGASADPHRVVLLGKAFRDWLRNARDDPTFPH